MSDNGPPFNGEEFRQFSRDFDFVHTTSSPSLPSVEWFHRVNGQEGQERLQKDGRIPQHSGQSVASAT